MDVLECGLSFRGCIVSEGMVRTFGRQISPPLNRRVGEIRVNVYGFTPFLAHSPLHDTSFGWFGFLSSRLIPPYSVSGLYLTRDPEEAARFP